MSFEGGHPKKMREKGGSCEEFLSNFKMAYCLNIQKNCYGINIEGRIQICITNFPSALKKTFDNKKHL